MKKTFNTPEDFYKNAMIGINHVIGQKLRTLGVEVSEIPGLVEQNLLCRYSSDIVDGIVLERYDYKDIMLAEFEWTQDGIKQRDINRDERDIRGAAN